MSDVESKVLCTPPPVGGAQSLSPNENLKNEIIERPNSPEINCAICLEELKNKSFTNTCLHQFCFHCLLKWSKVKAECPLCKQAFTKIYHNIRSNHEYDEHVLVTPIPALNLDPTVFINVAINRHRFRYRSTMGGSMLWETFPGIDQLSVPPVPNWPPTRATTNSSFPLDFSMAPRPLRYGATTTRSVTRSQRVDSSEFRRSVYRQGLWVRPSNSPRTRECSPEFYRLNPSQTHRLVPWLTRELNVLLDMHYDIDRVVQDIIQIITLHHINSSYFHGSMMRYLGSAAEHFIHEFYHFAISPYDQHSYDAHAQYSRLGFDFYSESDSDMEMVSLPEPEPLVSLDLTAIPGPSGLQVTTSSSVQSNSNSNNNQNNSNSSIIINRSNISINNNNSIVSHVLQPPLRPFRDSYSTEVIELSDDGNDVQTHDVDQDSDVEFIGSVPPKHLRTPEVITLETSDSDGEVEAEETKPGTSQHPVILSSGGEDEEIDDDDDDVEEVNTSTAGQSLTNFCAIAGPSALSFQCPIYDNCPYSRELTRKSSSSTSASSLQPTRGSRTFRLDSLSSCSTSFTSSSTSSTTSSSSSSSSSSSTSSPDHNNIVFSANEIKRRNRHKKCLSINKKKSHKNRIESSTSSSSHNNSVNRKSCNKRSRHSTAHRNTNIINNTFENESISNNRNANECNYTSDSCHSGDDLPPNKRQRPPLRLKSIVLKVDNSMKMITNNNNNSLHYKKRYIKREHATSDTDE